MKKVLVVSPHLDDAALSAGQFLAGRPEADVLTVFTGTPEDPRLLTQYDKDCGFKSSRDAIGMRKSEDERAMAILGSERIYLNFYDHQYKIENDYPSIVREIAEVIKEDDYEFILAPLGISHPDHLTTSNAVMEAAKKLPPKVYLWEDLPSRVLWPEDVFKRMTELNEEGIVLTKKFVGDGSMPQKLRALWQYVSQHRLLDINLCIVPERYYEVKHR